MKRSLNQLCVGLLFSMSGFLVSSTAIADGYFENKKEDYRENQRHERWEDNRDDKWKHNRDINVNIDKDVIVVPRKRTVNNIYVFRPYGHPYSGYGSYHNDNDAYKWLAFTAITLKILDNVNEAAQREHEAAQIAATTAPVGEKILWDEGDSSGYVVATREGASASSGLTCREYQQSITVGGNTEDAYGQACLQADGSWKIVS